MHQRTVCLIVPDPRSALPRQHASGLLKVQIANRIIRIPQAAGIYAPLNGVLESRADVACETAKELWGAYDATTATGSVGGRVTRGPAHAHAALCSHKPRG